MKVGSLAILVAAASWVPGSASAVENYKCWYESGGNLGVADQLHCRINGGEVIVYRDGDEPDVPLWPAVGDDGNGECHYQRTEFTGWYIVGYVGTDAVMQFDPDGIPGGPRIADAQFRRCDGEPWDIEVTIEIVWDILSSFDFEVPDPELEPSIGVTGLPTFIDLVPPADVIEQVVSPSGAVVEVEFKVAVVSLDWGDGDLQELSPDLYDLMAGHPDGEITHTYESKAMHDAVVDYLWLVRWRVDGGAWTPIPDIDPTTWNDTYQVDEIAGRRTG